MPSSPGPLPTVVIHLCSCCYIGWKHTNELVSSLNAAGCPAVLKIVQQVDNKDEFDVLYARWQPNPCWPAAVIIEDVKVVISSDNCEADWKDVLVAIGRRF